MKKSELKKLIREVVTEMQNNEIPADLEKDFQDWQDKEGAKDIEMGKLERGVNEALSAKGPEIIQKWIDTVGARQAGIKIMDSIIRKMVGLSTADLPDSATFANGLDSIEEALKEKDYQGAYNIAKETAQEMLDEEGFSGVDEAKKMENPCWKGYKAYGTKQKGGKEVPNCVPVEEGETEECYQEANWDIIPEGDEHTCEGDEFYECYGDWNADAPLEEAEYHGKKVKLGKPIRSSNGPKKFHVFVKNPKTGNVKKVNFGDPNMRIKKSIPGRRKSFRARHKCSTAKDRTSARYWSCRAW